MSLVSGARFGDALLTLIQRSKKFQIDPRVVIRMTGVPGGVMEARTDTVQDGGTNCVLTSGNRVEFEIQDISEVIPEAQLHFVVEDVDLVGQDFIGECFVQMHPYLSPSHTPTVERFQLFNHRKLRDQLPTSGEITQTTGLNVGRIVATIQSLNRRSEGGKESVTLVVEVWKLLDLGDSTELSSEANQLALSLASVMVLCYLGLGVGVYTGAGDNWSAREALYFAVCTFTTVGYGDFNAADLSDGLKIFTALYAFFGVALISAQVGIITSYFLEKSEKSLEQQLEKNQVRELTAADERKQGILQFARTVSLVLCALFAGMIIHHTLEDSTPLDAFYMACISISAVGYGDFAFDTVAGQWLAIFWIPIATAILASSIGKMIDWFVSRVEHQIAVKRLNQTLTPEFLEDMDEDGSGDVDEDEFVRKMLVQMGKVTLSDIRALKRKFRELDKSGDGHLSIEDLLLGLEEDADLDVAKCTSCLISRDIALLSPKQRHQYEERVAQILPMASNSSQQQ